MSDTRESSVTKRVPAVGLTGKSPASVCRSHEVVWTVAMTGSEVYASHSAAASIRGPPAAAAVEGPLIQPFQSRELRLESNSQRLAERTAPPYPEMAIIRSAPTPTTRYPVVAAPS